MKGLSHGWESYDRPGVHRLFGTTGKGQTGPEPIRKKGISKESNRFFLFTCSEKREAHVREMGHKGLFPKGLSMPTLHRLKAVLVPTNQ